MFTVYAISSLKRNYIYVGLTSNLENRVERHHTAREKTTRPYLPFKLMYTEAQPDRKLAR